MIKISSILFGPPSRQKKCRERGSNLAVFLSVKKRVPFCHFLEKKGYGKSSLYRKIDDNAQGFNFLNCNSQKQFLSVGFLQYSKFNFRSFQLEYIFWFIKFVISMSFPKPHKFIHFEHCNLQLYCKKNMYLIITSPQKHFEVIWTHTFWKNFSGFCDLICKLRQFLFEMIQKLLDIESPKKCPLQKKVKTKTCFWGWFVIYFVDLRGPVSAGFTLFNLNWIMPYNISLVLSIVGYVFNFVEEAVCPKLVSNLKQENIQREASDF